MYKFYEDKIELNQCPVCHSDPVIVHGGLFHENVRIQCSKCKKRTSKYEILTGNAAVNLAADEWNSFQSIKDSECIPHKFSKIIDFRSK